VHVVGSDIFTCRITSGADDYRYATRSEMEVSIEACALAGEIADRCRQLTRSVGLLVAGVDLRQTPEGEWYCFEVNPSPAFSYFQEAAHLPIDAAIAALLAP